MQFSYELLGKVRFENGLMYFLKMHYKIDRANLARNCRKLAAKDENLAEVLRLCGTPPLWSRTEGFSTMIQIILEQQVSLASARAAFEKCESTIGKITPKAILNLSDEQMRSCYFSRQKMGYAKNLARAVAENSLDFKSLKNLPDEIVRDQLMKIKGIGRWTADIYLLMAMNRADIMPTGDLALHVAWQRLQRLEDRPTSDEFCEIAELWKPLRSVAARLLWHYYLNGSSPK